MTERDRDGRFIGSDPLREAYNEHLERNRGRLARIFGTAAEDPQAEEAAPAGSFDGGARGSGIEAQPTMDDMLREASTAIRGGAVEVTIQVTDGEISRY